MTQTNPEQWALDLLADIIDIGGLGGPCLETDCVECGRVALKIQAAFAEREARLVEALGIVGKVLPSAAGLDDAPDSKIIACYMSMGEMRAIKEALVALKDRTHG